MSLHFPLVRLLTAALITTVAAGGALAQSTVTPAKKALVDKALQLLQPQIDSVAGLLANQPLQQLSPQISQALAQFPPERRELLGNEIQADARKYGDEVLPLLRAAVTKHTAASYGASLETNLSEDELKTVVAWLESPASKKLQRIGGEANQALVQKVVAETRAAIEPKIKALEASVAAKVRSAAQAAAASGATSGAKPAAPAPKK